MLELNKIHQGDCLERLKEIDDNSINLVVIDPPYNIGKDTWDKIDNYIEWFGYVLVEVERVMKDDGVLYFFHNQFLTMVEIQNWLKNNSNLIFRSLITIKKEDSFLLKMFTDKNFFASYINNSEYLLHYTFKKTKHIDTDYNFECFNSYLEYMTDELNKTDYTTKDINKELGYIAIADHWFLNSKGRQTHPRIIKEEDYIKIQTFTGRFSKKYKSIVPDESVVKSTSKTTRKITFNHNNKDNITNVWSFNFRKIKRMGHITPKPLELMKKIIKHSSNKGDLILDCFMGSGTTAVACKELGRDFVGIEKEQSYIDLTNKRLENTTQSHGKVKA